MGTLNEDELEKKLLKFIKKKSDENIVLSGLLEKLQNAEEKNNHKLIKHENI